MKKLISTALALIMLLASFSACAQTNETSGETDATGPSGDDLVSDTEGTTWDGKYTDGLPEKDYDGYTFNIYTRENTTHYNFVVEEMNGVGLNDAIYERNAKVADRFNINFTETTYTDETMARTNVMAGEDAYSIMNVRCTAANTMAQENLCYPINKLPYVDIEKPYWDADLTEQLAVGGKKYFAIGATNLSTYDFMNVLLFNKDMVRNLGFQSPYDYVTSGKWTLDVFGEMAAAASNDLNGDSKMNAKDQWGLLGVAKYAHVALLLGGDVKMINKDANGYPVYEMATDERLISVYEKVFRVTADNGAWYNTSDGSNEATQYHKMFRENQGMFLVTMFYYIETLRDMESEFGILPFPKYDEAQERYRNRISFFDTLVVPTTSSDLERTSIIIEALTCESMNLVIPAYYDIALKTKYARDEESQEMLDIIMANRVIDFGDTYFCSNIRDGWLANMFINNTRDLVSTASKYNKTMEKLLTKMTELYDSHEG